MDREIELKFLIAPEASDAILDRLGAQGAVRRLDATYYDTADHALRRAGFGLRVRDGDGGRKQTLKSASAGGVFARGEWEAPVSGPGPDRDLLDQTPAGRIVNGDVLAPVFAARVERTLRLVEHGGAVIEAALDRGELQAGTDRAAVSELELELKTGQPAALFDLARDLMAHAPLRLSLVSKAERGYALALGEAPGARREAAVLTRDMAAAEAFQALGNTALGRLCVAAEALADLPGPDAVHNLRVAARRLRALLKLFRPVTGKLAATPASDALKALANALGPARDLDVYIAETWRPAAEADPQPVEGLAALGKALIEAQQVAYSRALEAAAPDRFGPLALDVAAWLEAGDWLSDPERVEDRGTPARVFAAGRLKKLSKDVLARGEDLEALDHEERHALRIRGKGLRYAIDALAPLFPDHPKRLERWSAANRDLQDALGGLNDQALGASLARDAALAEGDPQAAYAAGALSAAPETTDKLMREAKAALAELKAVKPFW
ncbi:inorganic triphosphatase [Caulobacter flavus]|uniref:Inorganic triphosphatase n=1 Tax=Caulobacter flavus TaxID=1679497 RepID=A0A2N5CSP6_9CAUL|nr:CHAD domain-containing protein [Caulobacter flavus]AYV45654.1 inorganic triphosphatase [Caulobacter flavus]PLR13899.1 inorganic triphosphatase [Caulobacter flavus]